MSMKRILAIHDLSGFGHTSLLAAVPIFYRMGIEVAVLPTLLLSANTDHPGYGSLYTDTFMRKSLEHWQRLELSFDAIYSGFLGSEAQVELLKEFIPKLTSPDAPILVDPVLGDNGKLYNCYSESMIQAMRSLVQISSIVTPNLSELAFLLGSDLPISDLQNACRCLSALGPAKVIVTSAPGEDGSNSAVLYYNGSEDSFKRFGCQYEPIDFPGAGDCFASMFLAGLLNGFSTTEAIEGSIRFLKAAFGQSMALVKDRRSGIALAAALAQDPIKWFQVNLQRSGKQ